MKCQIGKQNFHTFFFEKRGQFLLQGGKFRSDSFSEVTFGSDPLKKIFLWFQIWHLISKQLNFVLNLHEKKYSKYSQGCSISSDRPHIVTLGRIQIAVNERLGWWTCTSKICLIGTARHLSAFWAFLDIQGRLRCHYDQRLKFGCKSNHKIIFDKFMFKYFHFYSRSTHKGCRGLGALSWICWPWIKGITSSSVPWITSVGLFTFVIFSTLKHTV